MSGPYKALKVSDHVYWVGAIDWQVRDFHGYTTRRGSTYNAYLIVADEITLIDTVKAPFREELLSRVSSVVAPREIKYLVSNHAEMDHSGSFIPVVEEIKPDRVFASRMGVKALQEHFSPGFEIEALSDGDSLELGGVSLTFLETRMLHWPDSMVTYLAEDRLLFSQDGFGMHLATSERYADELPFSLLEEEGGRYFANILLPYSKLIKKLLERVGELDIEIDMICPDHGPIWRDELDRLLGLYARWAAQEPTLKAVVAFDTMWHSTEKMAEAIAEGMMDEGIKVVVMSMHANDRSDVVTELLDAGALLVGTPTLNNNMFPSVADLLTYVKGLKPANLFCAAFGSYGWSGEGAKDVDAILQEMGSEVVSEPLAVKYVPDEVALEECRALGVKVAGRLKEVVNGG